MNQNDRIYVMGDIHGCFDKFSTLMDKVKPDLTKETMVFLGDYIDRGPASYHVVEHVMKLKKNYPNVITLMGNHERVLLDFLHGVDPILFLQNGGEETLLSYSNQCHDKRGEIFIPSEHLDFFRNLSLYYETQDYIFTHAGLSPTVLLTEQKEEDLLWIREEFIYSSHDFGKLVVFGHTPFLDPFVGFNKIGIDTGAVFGNVLTCLILPEMEFVSV